MSRPLRRLVADGWYHVFSRGLERREIFAEDRDRLHFLELQAELSERYRIEGNVGDPTASLKAIERGQVDELMFVSLPPAP